MSKKFSKNEILAMEALVSLKSLGSSKKRARFSQSSNGGEKERDEYFKTKTRKILDIGKDDIIPKKIFDDLITKEDSKKIVNQFYTHPEIVDNIAKYISTLPRPIGFFSEYNKDSWRSRSEEINEIIENSGYNKKILDHNEKENLYNEIAKIMLAGGYI